MHWYEWVIFGAVWMLIPALLLMRAHFDSEFAKATAEDERRAAPPAKGETK